MDSVEQPRTDVSAGPWLRLVSLAGLILIWHVAAVALEIRTLPTPWKFLTTFIDLAASGEIFFHVAITLARVAAAFTAAMVIGTAIGMVMGRYRGLDNFFDGWLILGLNMPALVITILCYIWFGLNDVAAVLAVTINKVPLVAVTVREGARAVQPELMQVAGAYRLSRMTAVFRVYVPQIYPYLMAAARGGLALIWKIVLLVELLGRSNGVGFQLQVYFQFFDIPSLLAYTFAFVAVVMAIEMIILRPLERRLTAWRL